MLGPSVADLARVIVLLLLLPSLAATAQGAEKAVGVWNVDDLRPGMKGTGYTVMKGTKVEPFDAEVLGVLKNTSPGRGLVLARLSGLDLERTGVIAGMSGSPVYVDGKLVGAVAYAWQFGKDPICGITPFAQMTAFASALDRREEKLPPGVEGEHAVPDAPSGPNAAKERIRVPRPLTAGDDELWLTPLRTPVAATGFTSRSLDLLRDRLRDTGLVPVQGGAAPAHVSEEERNAPLRPGSPLAAALVRGDFDLSGIGTVTHVDGDRVYGWGHPFLGVGACEFPLMAGYVHTVYPRQTVSFKMGSPLKTLGTITADVSTGIAGRLGPVPDMLPLRTTVLRDGGLPPKSFDVEIVRQRSLLASLALAVLTNSIDTEGDLPEEITADLTVRIDLAGRDPIVLQDSFSGPSYSGGRAPSALYGQVAFLLGQLSHNPFATLRVERIDCRTQIRPGRTTAEIEAAELDSDVYAPGDVVRATVLLRPFKGALQRRQLSLKLPTDLPEGTYTATVCDDLFRARLDVRDQPLLLNPRTIDQLLAALELQTGVRRNTLALRLPLKAGGVAVGERAYPNLPPSMVQILSQSRRTGSQAIQAALSTRQATPWILVGSESLTFNVTSNKQPRGD